VGPVVEGFPVIGSAVTIDVINTLGRDFFSVLYALAVLGIQLPVGSHAAEWIPIPPLSGESCPSAREPTLMGRPPAPIRMP